MNWLLLRGLVREQRHWGEFPGSLERLIPGTRTLTLDLPGEGTEHRKSVPLRIPEMTDDLRARFLAHPQRGEGPWGILAVSLGGMIALDWLSRYPGDFRRGVVINTSAADLSRPWERFHWRQYPTVLRCFAAAPLTRERAILAMTSNRADAHAALPERWARYLDDAPVSPVTALRQLIAAATSRLPERVGVATLVLASRADRLVSVVCSERIAKRLELPLRLHESAGHDLPLDDPRWVAEQVKDWLHHEIASAAPASPPPR